MKLRYSLILMVLLLGQMACKPEQKSASSNANETELRFRYPSKEQAQAIITQDSMEGFFEKVRPLEMQLQMRILDTTATRAELLVRYRDYLRAEVMPFSTSEQEHLKPILEKAKAACADFEIAWNMPAIDLIKVKGQHYDNYTYYTRDNAIIIPQEALERFEDETILSTILHEVFHVYSRYHPKKRKALYGLIGFDPIDTVVWSPFLDERIIFNPDGLDLHYAMELEDEQGNPFQAVPVIYSKSGQFRPERSRFFDYVQFELFTIRQDSMQRWQIVSEDRGISPQEAKGFQEQIGPNTQYIIHPDEILADNFVLLMLDESVTAAGERLQKEMAEILQREADG